MSKRELPKSGEIYKHFKNKMYQIITVATHTETGEQLVVYEALYDDFKMYARPVSMFLSEVDREKYPETTQRYRFELIEREVDGTLKMGYPVKKADIWKEEANTQTKEINRKNTELEREKVSREKAEVEQVNANPEKTEPENEKVNREKTEDSTEETKSTLRKTEVRAEEEAPSAEEAKIENSTKETEDKNVETPKALEETYLDDEEINPFLLSFLDTDSYSEKLQVLVSIRSRLDDRLIDDMATALDVTVEEGPLPERYESLKTCLDAMVKFECGRLR